MRPAGERGCLFLFLRTKLHHGEGDARRLTLDAVSLCLGEYGIFGWHSLSPTAGVGAAQRRRRRFEDGRNLTDWTRLRSMEMGFDEGNLENRIDKETGGALLSDGSSKSPAHGGVAL